MSARQWKPGDVALIRVGAGDWEYGVLRQSGKWSCQHGDDRLAMREVEARTVVVIDPEDREQVERLAKLYRGTFGYCGDEHTHSMQAALRSLTADPKPEEPLDPAVRISSRGAIWARVGGVWIANSSVAMTWDSLVLDDWEVSA